MATKSSIALQSDNASAPVLWTGPGGGEVRTNAREALLVASGAVTLPVGLHEPVVVKRGQSALFRADEPHRYRNDGETMARFVLAVHEPSGGCAVSARWLSFAA